ncbi:MAG: hypothetical protein H0U51_05220 [Propionibacteriales bacterium]|nr:hypothetical protein [Propionibacteriales bacterium]
MKPNDADIFYYACAISQRRRTSLGHFNSTSCGVRPLALRGDYVAAFDNSCLGPGPTRGILTVRDVPARRAWRIQEEYVELTGLEITAAGTAVWIRRGSDCTEPEPRCGPRVEVRVAERGRPARTLDSGDIDPSSLGLTNQTLEPVRDRRGPVRVVWISGGQPRSTVIR